MDSALIERLLTSPLDELLAEARTRRDAREISGRMTYSPKVFIPLTHLCRDVCHYCTFARPPRPGERAYMTPEEILDIARAGADPRAMALLALWHAVARRRRALRARCGAAAADRCGTRAAHSACAGANRGWLVCRFAWSHSTSA